MEAVEHSGSLVLSAWYVSLFECTHYASFTRLCQEPIGGHPWFPSRFISRQLFWAPPNILARHCSA